MNRPRSFSLVLLFAATSALDGCSSTTTHGDGGGGAGGQAGAAGGAGGGGGQADGGACRLQLQTCSDTQRCCSPLICAGNCTMPVTQDASADARPDCPSAPPAAGSGCTGTVTCYYQDCAHAGRTVASCGGGSWSVQTASCGTFACFPGSGRMCTGEQICSESAGGALLVECIGNTCGAGPISCGCLSTCSGSCTISGSVQTGFQVNCNTCPSNQCA